jgi:LD-carboxypeptidase N-terminal domain
VRRYLAGDDAMRAGDLRAALTDPAIAGILFARGGSGAQRTLEAMDWDGLDRKSGMPPKVLAGYSDVTALHPDAEPAGATPTPPPCACSTLRSARVHRGKPGRPRPPCQPGVHPPRP